MNAPAPTIWILEDDVNSQFVYDAMLGRQYELRFFSSLGDFTKGLKHRNEDSAIALLIVDLGLPDGSFLSFVKSPEFSLMASVPFLLVSSLDDAEALRICFNTGAIDYLTKPFGKGELTGKLERILNSRGNFWSYGHQTEFEVDPITSTIRFNNQHVVLTPKEFQIMALMACSPDYSVSRLCLIHRIWGNTRVCAKTLDVHLTSLRKKISTVGLELRHHQPNTYVLQLPKIQPSDLMHLRDRMKQ